MAVLRLQRWSRVAGIAFLPLALGVLLARPARPADTLYEVTRISVDVTAQDAVAARAQGMAEAQLRAVRTVLRRLLPASAQEQIPELSQEDVEGLVNGVSIRSEQNSTTRYLATLDVSVNERGIKQLLADQAIPFSEARAPSISILPLFIAGGSLGGEGAEAWRQAWEQLDLSHSTTPATILRPRPGLRLDSVRAVLAGDAEALAALQADYGYGPLVLAVAETGKGEFVTRLAGADATGAINFGRSDPLSADTRAIAGEAAATAFAIIENRWKVSQSPEGQSSEVRYEEAAPQEGGPTSEAEGAPPREVPRNVVAQVEFTSLKDWQDIRGRLMKVAGIEALEVNSLSARGASVTFDYAGSLGRLQKVLGENGFDFGEKEGAFVLRTR
jgi:uncharacterized protein DUF2066